MKVEQIYTGCLAEAAYYIESNGEAAIIDPLREVSPYIEKAAKDKAKIKYIFETHFHADFVSGHVDLAKKSGGQIVFGPEASAQFDFYQASDGEKFMVGDVSITALHTPGHTMESTTYLLKDESEVPYCIFSGDTLFIGDVGRPDLAVKSELTKEDLAGYLFDSLREKIMPLPDDVIVYPAHGAGSACGKNMSKETYDTLGNQKKVNYALNSNLLRTDFIAEVTSGLTLPPQYFPKNVAMNKGVNAEIGSILKKGTFPLEVNVFEDLVNQGALMLDVRSIADFEYEHIPNSIFIGLDGGFAPWVGTLIADIEQPIVLITPEGREEEAVTRLSRIGYDNSLGYLNGGLEAWKDAGHAVDVVQCVSPEQFAKEHANEVVADVRKVGEFNAEHVKDAEFLPLDDINEQMSKWDRNTKYFVHCRSGYRSVIAISILKSRGVHNLVNVREGFLGIQKTDVPLSNFVCAQN